MKDPAFRVTRYTWIAIAISVLSACGGSGGSPSPMPAPSPTPGPVETLQISPVTSAVSPGNILHLTATLTKTDGTHADVTPQAIWSISNNVIAWATSGGRIVAISPGSTTVTANYQGAVGETPLDVTGKSGSVAPGYAYFLAGSNPLGGSVSQYRIDSGGSMAQLSVPSVSTGNGPRNMVADPTGHYVYVVNATDATISQYMVGPGGGLTALSPAIVAIPAAAYLYFTAATVDPLGRFLYVLFVQNSIANSPLFAAQYSIGSDGVLNPLVPFVVKLAPSFLETQMVIEPSGRYAYIATGGFSIGSDGTLTPLSDVPGPGGPLAIAPSGHYLYSVYGTWFSINPDGALAPTGGQWPAITYQEDPYSPAPVGMTFSSAGPSAYMFVYDTTTVEATGGAVYAYRVTDSGGLVLSNSFPTQGAPGTETSNGPNPGFTYGPNLYVLGNACYGPLCRPQGYIDRFTIDEAGDLTPAGAVFLGTGGPGIAFSNMVLVPAD